MKRTHTTEQDNWIRDMKFKYLTSSTKQEQDMYAKILLGIEFF